MRLKLLALLLCFLSSIGYAEPRMTRLNQGTMTPYAGVLLNNEAEAAIRAKMEEQKQLCLVDIDSAKKQKDIDCSKEKSKAANECSANAKLCEQEKLEKQREIDRVKSELKKYENQQLIDYVYAGSGFVVGAGLVILVVKALNW